MEIVKEVRTIHGSGTLHSIRGYNEYERFASCLTYLKQWGIIKSFTEFAENIGESSVGLNDLKKGRKKISIKHVKNMNISYPFINTDYIILDEGRAFTDNYLIKFVDIDNPKDCLGYHLNIKMAKQNIGKGSTLQLENKTKSNSTAIVNIQKELLDCKTELIDSKNEIIKLNKEVHTLKIELLKTKP